MKLSFLLSFCCFLSLGIYAQTPSGINYQAVARDGNGALLQDEDIDVTFTIRLIGSGTAAYVEAHDLTTNNYGLFSTVIGTGIASVGLFSSLDWSNSYELGVSINGESLGFTAFQSVPYALSVAEKHHLIGIPAAAFFPNNNECTFRNSIGNGGVEITSTIGATVTSVLNASVQLPDGAQVDSMTVYYTDNSEAQLIIWLAKEFYSPGFDIIAQVITTGNSSASREETVTVNKSIDNENGGYFLRIFCDDWDLAGSKSIKGVKIYYRY